MMKTLTISAACLINDQGQILLVRKRGTTKFMQPGGKPEPGETPIEAVMREVSEELGVDFEAKDLEPYGEWSGPAANEEDTSIQAYLFAARFNGSPEPLAELEELLWIDPRDALLRNDIAPLLREHVLPTLLANANDMGA
ncbi:NUDIX hydrolase [Glutamicibacter bergerei]|uniref:NUDIX domain-containing protein n=2 Tax=Glutamicibacter TaxID=1742989 RepID=A0ABV9MPX3_9MICC|nr:MULTISPECIES: NUDIX domain-containing protein [Glutamicibacter]PCC34499.1 NTP pyrophosphohydrolase [Glutamicibacter sp. BW77]HBV10014.1 NUDIX domain-containing protein [Micrococcaceae bacterium]